MPFTELWLFRPFFVLGKPAVRAHWPVLLPVFMILGAVVAALIEWQVDDSLDKIAMAIEPQLPTERDFNPWNDETDANTAWQHFGNLTLDEAYARFCEDPTNYQEDFMFMGGIAFAYYFDVIERYIKSAHEIDSETGDHQAWVLAKAIQNQFDGDSLSHVQHLRQRVVALSNFVHENIERFGEDDAERNRVADAWTELASHITP